MKERTFNTLHYVSYVALLLLLVVFSELGGYYYQYSLSNYTWHSYVFSLIFALVFGIALFTRYYISTRTNHSKPVLVRGIIIVATTAIGVYVYRYVSLPSLTLLYYVIILWTENLCEFYPRRQQRP